MLPGSGVAEGLVWSPVIAPILSPMQVRLHRREGVLPREHSQISCRFHQAEPPGAPAARDVNTLVTLVAEHFRSGQRLAGAVTDRLGSWPFIINENLVPVA